MLEVTIMEMRQKGQDMTISARMNKSEWAEIVKIGNDLFNCREIGYLQIVPNKIHFEKTSPFYKDKRTIDLQDKERTDEDQAKHESVLKEIKNKVVT